MRLNSGCLSLQKRWEWAVCHGWGPWSCVRGSGLSACAFQAEQQPGALLHPGDRPEGAERKPEPGIPTTNRSISPTHHENAPQMGEFPWDKSANKSGLGLMSWSSCPDTWSRIMSQSQGQNPWQDLGHTGYCHGSQTDWAHEEFACKEPGELK